MWEKDRWVQAGSKGQVLGSTRWQGYLDIWQYLDACDFPTPFFNIFLPQLFCTKPHIYNKSNLELIWK